MNQPFDAYMPIVQLAGILRRRWGVVALCTMAAAMIGAGVGSLMQPRYTAKVQIILDEQAAPRGGRLDDAAVQTWVELLSNENHVRQLHEGLEANPVEPDAAPFGRPIMTELAESGLAALRSVLDGFWPARDPDEGSMAAGSGGMPTYRELERGLRSYKERQSRILSVAFTWTDPNMAAAIANRSAMLFLDGNLQAQRVDREKAREVLQQRTTHAREELKRVATALAQFRVEHGVADADGTDQIDAQIAEVNRQLSILNSSVPTGQAAEARHGSLAMAARLPVLAQQVSGPPPVRDAEAGILEARMRYLVARLAVLQEASAGARSAEARLRELRLEAGSVSQTLEALLRQAAELRDAAIVPEARIVSMASAPALPSSPDPIFFLPPALLAGAIGGGLLAILLERVDRRLRSERTAEAALGVRCIGVVPRLRRGGILATLRALPAQPFAPYTRAIRSVVMAVLDFPVEPRTGKVILFASSANEDGKTALAVSFASYAALLRRNVLVIDLDLPSPGIGRLLGDETGLGALDVLQGAPPEDAIRTNADLQIDYLPLPAGKVDPLLLMANWRMRVVLEEMRRRYDCVVISGAPLIGNPEARTLVALADHVILTLKWGSTDLDTARAAMREIRKAHDRADGNVSVSSVLTQVDLRLHAIYRSDFNGDEPGTRHGTKPLDSGA